jgi:nitrogen fixation NifU-like protein
MENRPGAVDDLTRLYREAIKRHATHPVGYGVKIDATHRHEKYNPLCGDRVLVLLRVSNERVDAAAFEGEACAICMASASMLCELAPGKMVAEVMEISEQLNEALGGSRPCRRLPEDQPEKDIRRQGRLPQRLSHQLLPLLGVTWLTNHRLLMPSMN